MTCLALLILSPLASIPSKEALPLPPPPPGTAQVQGQQNAGAEGDAEDLELPPPPPGLKLLQPVEKRALVQTGLSRESEGEGEDGAAPDAETEALEMEALRALELAALDVEGADAAALLQTLRTFGPSHPLRLRLEDVLEELDHREGAPPELGRILDRDLMAFDVDLVRDRYDIPVEMQPLVAYYIRFFQGPGRKWFGRWMARSTRFLPVMQPILEEYGLPRDTVYVAMIESGFSTRAYSWAHAAGPWQFIPTTGREYGLRQDFWVDERRDPIKATHAAARFLRTLHKDLGHWYLAWAGYNTGGGRMRRLVDRRGTSDFWTLIEGRGLMKETQHYVPKVIAAALVAKNPTAFGFSEEEFDFQAPLEFDLAHFPEPTDLDVIARAAGVTEEDLLDLNPELNRWCTPPATEARPYALRLPLGTGALFAERFAVIPPQKRLRYVEHTVRRGDTLSGIAQRHGSTAEAILRFNRLGSARALKVNSTLMIPVPRGDADRVRRADPPRPAARRQVDARGTTAAPARASKGRRVHVLARGETLWSLSRRYGVSVDELRKWNRIGDSRSLQAGQPLRVASP